VGPGFARSPEDGWSGRQKLGCQLNRPRMIEIDVDEPVRRLAQEYADVLGLTVEVVAD